MTQETLQKFGCGYIAEWLSPDNRMNGNPKGVKPSRRIIIPSGECHYLARAIDRNGSPKPHAGSKALFNQDALKSVNDGDIVLVTEGEIDAMSIDQATESAFPVVATCGASSYKFFIDAVQSLKVKPFVIILFDSDSTGRTVAVKLKGELLAAGIPAQEAFLFDHETKRDANDVLRQKNGAASLSKKINKIVDICKSRLADIQAQLDATPANTNTPNSETFPNLPAADSELTPLGDAPEDKPPEARKTTKQLIEDCPVDIDVPVSFELDQWGVWDYSGDYVSSPVVVSKNFISSAGNECVELAILKREVDGKYRWSKCIVPKSTIADHKKILCLTDYGVNTWSANAKRLSAYLMQMINCGRNRQLLACCELREQPGWNADASQFFYPVEDNAACRIKSDAFDYNAVFTPKGDRDNWLILFRLALQASPVVRFVSGAALVAPAIKILNLRDGFWVHLGCPSGNGKTAAVKLALSIFGKPSPDGLFPTLNATKNFLENIAIRFNDFPHGCDELQMIPKLFREGLADSIYAFSGGFERGRLNKDSVPKLGRKWRGIRFTTGEQNIITEASGKGVVARCLDVSCSEIFSDEQAVLVHETLVDTYGHYGRRWVEWLTSNKEAFYDSFRERCDDYRKKYPTALPDHIKILAASRVALEYFSRVVEEDDNLYNHNFREKLEELEPMDVKKILEGVPDADTSRNYERARDALAAYVLSHMGLFKTENQHGEFSNDVLLECLGCVYHDGSVALFPNAARKMIDEIGFPSAEAIFREFDDAGYLVSGNCKRQPHRTKTVVDNSNRKAYVYLFKPGVLGLDADD